VEEETTDAKDRFLASSDDAPGTRDRFGSTVGGYQAARQCVDERQEIMGISASLILIAVGAILTWAVTTEVSGVDINTVGVILMVVGLAGALISVIFWSTWGGFGYGGRDTTTVVRDRDRIVER
jgi:hypothetical protein